MARLTVLNGEAAVPGLLSLPLTLSTYHWVVAVKETLGDTWLNSSRYRFGASSLLNDLLRQIEKEKTGAYQAPYYFTEASESY